MATWIRQGTGTAPSSTDAELVGDYALDNATAPADFDPAAVTSVQCQWTITGSGFVDDSWDNVAGVAVETGVTEISQHPGNGGTSLQNESSASDHTDSTGIPTGLTVAEWEAALVRGDGTTVPDEWCLWNKVKGPDGSTLTVSLLTVTITYTPASGDVTGTSAPVQDDQTSSASGTVVPPAFTGTAAPIQDDQTSSASGSVVPPAFTGTLAVTQDDQTSAASGTVPGEGITIVGTPQSGSAVDGGDVTLTFDGTPAEGDVVILVGGNGDNDGAGNIGPSTAGYTQRGLRQAASEDWSGGVWTKVLGATPDATVVGQGSGNTAEATAYTAIVLRGVDAAVLDAAVVETGPTVGDDPDLTGLTTVTDGAWVVIAVVTGFASSVSAYPTGYSNGTFVQGTDTRRSTAVIATKEVAAAGAEDPGAFTWTIADSGGWFGFTVAIQPAGAGGDNRTGTSAPVQDDQTSTASGVVVPPAFSGTLAVSQENQISIASGAVVPPAFTGTSATTQDDNTSSATGAVVPPAFVGTSATTQDDQTSTASGTVTDPAVTGTLVVTQQDQFSTASGTVVNSGISGSLAASQENQVSEASGTFVPPAFTGTAAPTQDDQTATASGTFTAPGFTGTSASVQDDQVSTASGTVTSAGISGSLAVTQENQTATATGSFTPSFTGTLAVTQDDQTLLASGIPPRKRTEAHRRGMASLEARRKAGPRLEGSSV